ncbi:HEAT repeat domain-containing protein [bacterium]|nr:HEAT repeat domain-containing protein [bacterium]
MTFITLLLTLLSPLIAHAAQPAPLAIELAMTELQSDDWILAWRAMTQLAHHKAAEAVPPLRAILTGKKHPWLRGRALVALAELLGNPVVPEALAFAGSDRPELRAAAVEALGILGSPKGEAPIRKHLADPVAAVRYQAVVALARLKGNEAWKTIEPLLADQDTAMVQHAIRSVVHIDAPAARARIVALLEHEHRDVRTEAAGALGQVALASAIPALLGRMAKDPDATVRVACEAALAKFDAQALAAPTLAAIEGDDKALYRPALTIVGLRPSEAVCDRVADLFRAPAEARTEYITAAFDAVTRLDPDRYSSLFAAHRAHARADVRRKAVECLARCKKADLYALLKPALIDEDKSVYAFAFQVLRKAATAPPKEGIVAYLAEPLQRTNSDTLHACLAMVHDHVTPPELDKALAALGPLLGGKDARTRDLAAKAIERICTDDARRRVAAAQGALAEWMVIGPFPNDPSHKAHDVAYFPEHEIDLAKAYPEHYFGCGAQFRVGDAASGKDRRKALDLRLPHERNVKGHLRVAYTVRLPEGDGIRLLAAAALEDGSQNSDGVTLQVLADKTTVLEVPLDKPDGWKAIDVDLSARAGKLVTLAFVLDPRGHTRDDRVLIAAPRIAAGGKDVADLLALAPKAAVTIALPKRTDEMRWQPLPTVAIDGTIPLHDQFPLPVHYQTAYALADVESTGAQTVRLNLKWQNDLVLWLNGKQIFAKRGAREETIDLPLTQGRNRILAKIGNERDAWTLRARLTDKDGKRLDTVRVVPREQ